MAGMMPTAASSTSPTAFTILDVDQNAYLFVGGIIGSVKVSSVCVHGHISHLFFSSLFATVPVSFRELMP